MVCYQSVRRFRCHERGGAVIVEAMEKPNRHLCDSLARYAGDFERAVPGAVPVPGSAPVATGGPNRAAGTFDRGKQGLPFATVQPVMAVAGEPLGDSGHHAEVLGVGSMEPPDLSPPFRSPEFLGRRAYRRPRFRCHSVNHTSRFERPKARVTHDTNPTPVLPGFHLTRQTQRNPLVPARSHEVAPFGRLSPSAAQGIANRLMWKGWNLDRIARILEFAPFGFRNTRRVAQFAVSPQVSNEQIA